MNEKYIQSLILGSLIGGAILLDDYVNPSKEKELKKAVFIKTDSMSGNMDSFEWDEIPEVIENVKSIEGLNLQKIDDLEDTVIEKLKSIEGLNLQKIDDLEDVKVEIKIEVKKEDD